MHKLLQSGMDQAVTPYGSSRFKALYYGFAFSFAVIGFATAANATNYNEAVQGDLSGSPSTPTSLNYLTLGDNEVVGSSVPSGDPIPDGHGALTNQDNDFFTFNVPIGEVLTHFYLGGATSIADGDRFFLGLYSGKTAAVDPNNPTPAGLLGYTLPGPSQIGTDLLPALAASDEPGFPPLPTHFSGNLGPGSYTVWVVDGDRPVSYDLRLVTSAVPESGTWAMMVAGMGIGGTMLRRRRTGTKRGSSLCG